MGHDPTATTPRTQREARVTTDNESGRDASNERDDPGQTIAGHARSPWPEPPIALDRLPLHAGDWDAQMRPDGPLSGHVGPRITVQDIYDEDRHSDADLERLSRVKAWPVLSLVGVTFGVASVEAVAPALRLLLSERLPGLDWWVRQHWGGPLLKYGIVHGCIPAPPNTDSCEAMALEIFGTAHRALKPGSEEWRQAQQLWLVRGGPQDERPAMVSFPTKVTIETATYANVAYPGVRVPFYM